MRATFGTLWMVVAALSADVLAADTGTMAVSAVVLSKSNCKFSGTGVVTLNFGAIDPSSTSSAVATASRVFSCKGSAPNATFLITAGDGLHSGAPGVRRMQHATTPTEYLQYSLALTPTSATVPKNVDQTLTITGTIAPSAFGAAMAGSYSDTVAITLTP